MVRTTILVVTFLALGSCFAQAQIPTKGMVPLYTFSHNDKVVDYSITEAVAKRQPQWDPSQSMPPLSVPEAIAIAREWLAKTHPKFDAFEPADINLRRIRYRGFSFWFYSLRFDGVVSGTRTHSPDLEAVVLFDRGIVEPKPGVRR